MSVVLLVGASSSSRLFEILDLLHFEEDTPTKTNLILIITQVATYKIIDIKDTFLIGIVHY